MPHCNADDTKRPGDVDAFWDRGDEGGADALPAAAQHTLDRLADALGVTTALLRQDPPAGSAPDGLASLPEASALLKAFIQITDPNVRRSCVAFVQKAAAEERG